MKDHLVIKRIFADIHKSFGSFSKPDRNFAYEAFGKNYYKEIYTELQRSLPSIKIEDDTDLEMDHCRFLHWDTLDDKSVILLLSYVGKYCLFARRDETNSNFMKQAEVLKQKRNANNGENIMVIDPVLD